ncbi:MAG: hypothetical protein PHD21_06765 [Flavobacteriales bacterium]|nr:hypothetical protein [Flavobacteriales bacterium]
MNKTSIDETVDFDMSRLTQKEMLRLLWVGLSDVKADISRLNEDVKASAGESATDYKMLVERQHTLELRVKEIETQVKMYVYVVSGVVSMVVSIILKFIN